MPPWKPFGLSSTFVSRAGLGLKLMGWGDVELIVDLIWNSSSFCYRLLVVFSVIFFFVELWFYLLVSSSSVTVGSGDRNIITVIFFRWVLVQDVLTYSDVPSPVHVPESSPVWRKEQVVIQFDTVYLCLKQCILYDSNNYIQI